MTFTIEDKRVLVLIVFSIVLLLFVYNGSALEKNGITVKLISNTDRCEDCKTVYNVCFDQLTASKITDYKFLFSDEISKEQNTLSSLKSVPIISYKLDKTGLCYDVTITATKSPFANVDNILCFKDICFKEYVWWNASFSKCVKYSIVGTPNFPVNYENEIKINNSLINYGNFTGNFIDVRFTNGTDCNSDSGVEMNYWRHNSCDRTNTSANCSFFINMTKANMTSFLMYFGNVNATDVSNGFITFHNFDNFNNGTILSSLWTKVETKGTVAVSGGFLNINAATTAGSVGYCFDDEPQVKFNTSLTQFIVEVDVVNFQPTINYQQAILTIYQNSTDCNAFLHGKNDVTPLERLFWTQRVALTNYTSSQLVWSSPNVSLRLDVNGAIFKYYYSICLPCSSWIYNGTSNRFLNTLKEIKLSSDVGGQPQITATYWDNFRVRLYVNDIPSWTNGNIEIPTNNFCNYTFNILDNDTIVHLTNVTLIGDFGNFTNVNSPFNSNNITNGTHNFTVSAIGYYEINDSLLCNVVRPTTNMTIYLFPIPVIPSMNITNMSGEICCPDWNLATKSICSDNLTLYQEYNEYHCLNGLCENATAFRYVNCPYGCVEQTDNMGDGCISPNYQLDFMFIISIVIILIIIGYLWKRK